MFDYFYGPQAEQFAFYRVPKVLFTNDRFKYLSAEAKTLYGILLDRVPLSAKNGWIDEQGRVYIICTIEEIMEDMNCGNKKAIQLLSDLEEKVGLIERKRQGLGKPNLIYVKNFISVDNPVERHFLKCQNDTSGSVEITSLEVSKGHGNKTDIINTEYSDTDSFYSDRGVGKGSEAMRIRSQYEDYFREWLDHWHISLQTRVTMNLKRKARPCVIAERCMKQGFLLSVRGSCMRGSYGTRSPRSTRTGLKWHRSFSEDPAFSWFAATRWMDRSKTISVWQRGSVLPLRLLTAL